MKPLANLIEKSRFTSGWVYGLIPWMLIPVLILPLLRPVWENDFFLHIQMGRDILLHHRLSGNPDWLYGPARSSWMTTMAVSEVLMYLVYHLFGFIGFTLLEVTAGLLLIPIIFYCVKQLASKPLTAGAVKVGSIIASGVIIFYSWGILPRPQTVSLLIFPFVCLWLIELATNGNAPKMIPSSILVVVWTWFHGYSLLVAPLLLISATAYILGAIMVEKLNSKTRIEGEGAGRQAFKKIILQWRVFLALFIVPIVNPIGYQYWIQSLKVRAASANLISEWRRPNLSSISFLAIISMMAFWLAFTLYHWFKINGNQTPAVALKMVLRSIVREGLLIVMASLILGQTERTSLLLVPLIGLILARRGMITLDGNMKSKGDVWKSKGSKRLAFLTTGLIVTFLVVSNLGGISKLAVFSENQAPVKIFSAMKNAPGEHRVLISYNIYSTLEPYVPNSKVSIDGRTDKFGHNGAYEYYRCINAGLGCEKILGLYKDSTDAVLSNKDKVSRILKSRGWINKMTVKTGALDYTWWQAPKKK